MPKPGLMSTGRLEAFSDGVLAVAITLLVLDIKVPPIESPHTLGHELARQWPTYFAYITSFVTIGIIWINHHLAIGRLRETDHAILIINLLLLMTISVIPFATSLIADYLKQSHGQHLAAAVYSGTLLVMGLCFVALNRAILLGRPHLMVDGIDQEARRELMRRNLVGILPYALALALSPVSAYVTLGICFAVAAFYALPFGVQPRRGAAD